MQKQNKKEIFKEIFRFLIVGGFATICDFLTLYLFNLVILKDLDTTANVVISTTLGFLVGLFVNWVLQKFVFRYITDDQTKSPKVFLKFFILSLLGLGITQLGMFLGDKFLFRRLYITIFVEFDFWFLFMKCFLTGIVLVINYIGRKLFVFRGDNKKEE